MSVSYEYYKIFYYVAKYKSFNKAAAVLSNSQPNISRSITNLEAELNCKLFHRSNRGVTLTDAGKELFYHVDIACRHLNIGEEIIRDATALKSGTLTIGSSIGLTPSIMRYMIFPAMGIFKKEYPDIKFKILNDTTPALISNISNKLIDMAIITTSSKEIPENSNLNKTIFHSYRNVAIAGINYKELQGRKVSIKELMNYPLISLWHDTESYNLNRSFFAEHGLEFNPSIETTSTGQTLGYTKGNLGISCIHPKEATEAIKEKKVFQLDMEEELPMQYVALIYDKQAEKKAIPVFVKTFLSYIKEHKDILD
ncbi:MAG: LysR family transcriptional regulator [Lachnospiraceae bacterium]|nr:LysR family transcriptional regulator [Lachnospiraceae bacterium]